MARIEPLSAAAVDPSLAPVVAEAQERLPRFLNQVLTLAHHPQIGRDLVTLYLGFQSGGTVDHEAPGTRSAARRSKTRRISASSSSAVAR